MKQIFKINNSEVQSTATAAPLTGRQKHRFAKTTTATTGLACRALLLLALLMGWVVSAQADDRVTILNVTSGNGDYSSINYSAFGSYDDSYTIELNYHNTQNQSIANWGIGRLGANSAADSGQEIHAPADAPANSDFVVTYTVGQFKSVAGTSGGVQFRVWNANLLSVVVIVPVTDSFVNTWRGNKNETKNSKEIERTTLTATVDYTDKSAKYARIYVTNATGTKQNSWDTNLLEVTYNGIAATQGGSSNTNGVYVSDTNGINFDNLSVTLKAGAGNFKNYKVVTILSNDAMTGAQEPAWDEQYTYSYTYPAYEQRFDLDESILNQTMVEIDNSSYYRDLILTHYGKTANQIKDNWYGRWYVTDESGNRQNLALGTANGTNWVITPRNENEGQNWNTYSWSVADNIAYTNEEGRKNDWFVNQSLCRGRIYAPSSSTFQDYGGYKLVFEATDNYTSGTPDINVRFIFSIPSTVVFEGEANTGAVADATGTQKVNAAAASVNLDLTNKALAHSKVASADIKYARFYLTDAEGTIVDPTGKMTVKYNGTTISANCPKANQGFYVYDNGNTLDKTKFEVTLTTPNAYTDYKVVALFAVNPLQNIVESSGTVSEEPDYDLKYTYSFANIEFEYSGTVTNTPITQQFANATDDDTTVTLDWSLIDNLPSGIKYARFYVLDASGNAVDASDAAHQLNVSNGTLCDNHTNGYYVYTGSDLTLGNVKLTSNGGSVLPYRVVCWIATSETGIYKDGNTVLEEPDITNGYVYSFRKPVQHTEKTGTVEWSPVSMTVPLNIDTHKGSGYLASLGTDYHVVWTVSVGGTETTPATGNARQSGQWTMSVSGNNATFYAPTGQTFADMSNVTFVARLYETATGENDADKSLTYTVSIVKTGFFGELKDPTAKGSTTMTLTEESNIPVSVPLGNATTAFSGAKYVRVWLTQGSTLVAPTGKLAVPAGMTAFGNYHDVTYGYYLYDANGITLSNVDLTLDARADYPQYQVHIALSADAPISYVDFARSSGPLRAPSDAHEPDYDYEYTINFAYQDNSMRVIPIYVKASENTTSATISEHHGNDYTANFKSLIENAFTELGITLDANTTFTKWDVVKDGNLVDLNHDYAAPNTIQIEHGSHYLFANHYQDSNKQYGYYNGGQNALSLDDNLNATIHFGNGVFQLGSIIECWVTNVNSQSNADPTDGYKVKVEVHFNEDGNPPFTFVNETDITATKKMVNVSTLDATNPTFDMTDALVSGAKYARIYLAKYGEANDVSSNLTVTYDGTDGTDATACADPYGRYGWYISDADGIDLTKLVVGSSTLSADDMLKYNLIVVSSTSALTGDQEPAWEQKTVYSFQKEVMVRIYADEENPTTVIEGAQMKPSDTYTMGEDILRRIDANVSDFSKTLYVKWYVEDKNGVRQAVGGGNGASSSNWSFEILNSGLGNWVDAGDVLQFYTNQDADCDPDHIAEIYNHYNGWTRQITKVDNIHVQVPGYLHNYTGYRIVYEFSDEYDTADGADPGFRLRYVYTITDPKDFEGTKNSGGAEETVTQIVNRTAESINLTLDDNNAWVNSGWAFEHQKLNRWQGGMFGQWVQVPLRYARFYLIDAEGNQVNPTGKLTVTYGGDNASVTACTTPEHGFYIFGEGGTTINRNQVTVSLAAPKEYKLYKVVCVFSTALDGIVPEDLTTPLQREPDYDLKYTYSFDYPEPTTKEITVTIPWSKAGMTLRANTDADGNLLTATSVDDAWGISFPELSAGQYVRWYVRQPGGPGGYQRQELVSGSERTNGAWALKTTSVYNFLDRANNQGGDQAVLTGRTDFTVANWNDVWSSPTIYAPAGQTYDNVSSCQFICEIYDENTDNGHSPYVRYIFNMVRFLGDPKDNAGEGEETILLDRNTTSVDLSLQEVFAKAKAQVSNAPIYYVRVWLTKSDGTPVNPAGALNWQQMYNGSNQVNTFNSTAPQNPVYGYYFCSSDIGEHKGGVEGLDAAATLSLPIGHFSQYQVHVALSQDNPTGMQWNNTTSRWEFADGTVAAGTTNALAGSPAEPDYDYVYTFKFDYGFEAHNIKTVKTKYKTVIYNETTRTFTPTLFQNWLEVAADCDVQRQELADKAYARWYLEDLEGNLIQIDELTSPQPYISLGNPYGFYRYKFDVSRFGDTKGLTDNGYNPTIVLPAGYDYDKVRLVCVVTTKTTPQTEDPTVPIDIPATEPQDLQVKYVYTLVKQSEFANLPFVHYQGETYKWLTQMGRSDEAAADRDYIIVDGTAGAEEKSWDFENQKVSEETFGNIRQNVHTVDYYVYFDPADAAFNAGGAGKSLMLPSQYYFGSGNDTEPRAYYRWYDYNTDVKASYLTAYGSQLHLYPNDPTVTTEKAGDPSRGLFAMLVSNDEHPCDANIGVRFHAPSGWNAKSDEILLACDVSRYMDGMDDSFHYLMHEPTLSVRYLFHILPAQKIAGDIAAAATTTIEGTAYTGLEAVEQNLLAGDDTELYEYNGRTVVSLNGTEGKFTMRSDLQKLDSYWVYGSGNSLVNCNTLQWYAYYFDDNGDLWKLKVPMGDRAGKRLDLYQLSDFNGAYTKVGGSETKEITVQSGDRLYMIGCMGNGYDEAPVVWNELNFIDAKPLLIGTEGTVPERTDQYMRSEYTLAQVLDFNDFFDEDERFNKPTSSYENYAKVPITFPNAQYGFCYPQLYGLCGTNKFANWGVYGVSPTHGDYTLLKSMNLPGVSADENFTEQSIGSQWWWNEPLYDVTHTRAANGNVATDANDYGTFLYVDASDEARVIAELEFDAALCADAEIYYTAYVADMTNNVTRPQVRFRVSTDVDGKRVPVVTFETGNIVSEGATTGFWHQVYGHTTLPARLHHILNGTTRHYYVSVENSCEDTNGADYTVDQITFYTHQASVKAKIVSDICDDGPVRVKIVAEAEQLQKSLKALTTAATKDVFFCIVERYDDLNHELHAEDILTGLGYYTDQNNQPSNEYSVVSVPLSDDNLNTTDTELPEGTNSGFYYDDDEDKVYFQLDEREFKLEPGKKYFVSIYDIAENRVGSLTGWGTPYSGNACTIYSNEVSPNRMYIDLSIDGQSTDGHIEFGCNATTVTKKYDIAINYPTGDGYDKYTFFNYDFFELAPGKTKADFLGINVTVGEKVISLADALQTFRDWMRNDMIERSIPESERDYAVPGDVYTELPQPAADDTEHMAMYNLIMKYMGGGEDCPEGKLYLSATSSIERTFTEPGVYKYLAIPLTKKIPTGGEVCSPLEFAFDVDARYGGPQIELGFDDVDYPDGYIRSVRVGLEQLNKMITIPTGGSNYMLHIPVSSYTNKRNGFGNRIYFQHTVLYLSKTNDPTIATDEYGTPTSTNIKVGEIKVPEHIGSGRAYVGPDRMFLPIDFSTCDITFHEGYYYEVGTTFVDEEDDGAAAPCTGDLFFIIKVVPEFATWQSTEIMSHDSGVDTRTGFFNANWYQDANWQRSVRADLYKDAVGGQQNTVTLGHPTGYNNNGEGDLENLTSGVNPGFVPMKFTYVTILGGNHAPSLIKEPKVSTSSSQQGGGLLDPNLTRMLTDPSPYTNQLSSEPTENIRYDMLVRYGAHSEGGEGCFGHRQMSMNAGGKYIWGNDPREDMTSFNDSHKAFDVEKFYGNICKEIYFKPGAELLRQQRLSYNRAWVEKEVNANKWYLVSSPLKDTYAGDMYVPTKMKNVATNEENVPGQQLTEAFQPINFNTAAVSSNDEHTITSQPAYSRTKYPIYQRSWNTDGSKVYTKTNDARATDYSANLVYPSVTTVATEWSHTYNDVQVPYTTLTGFSIRADRKQHVKTDGSNSVDVPALIRLPKADTQYDYYQWDNTSPADGKLTHSVARTTTPQTSYPLPSRYPAGITDNYRFVVDDPEADGLLTIDISALQQQDGYILVGNPQMASLRMDEFFKGNPGLVPSYWTYEASVASAALATPTTITATGNGIIRPLQAFFVKKKAASELNDGEDEATAIVFTRAMTIDGNYPAIPETSPSRQLTLSVADTEGASSAVVLLSDEADGDYREGEDVETLFDSNLADVPMVYTVAGGQAVSIDQRPQLDLVSFGVVQAKNEPVEVKVTSHLSNQTSSLYFIDALTGEQTPVNDGTTLTVQPNDYGRYFLSTTAVQSSSAKEQSIIISVRQQEVTVTANGGQLSTVRATTLNGVAAYSSDAGLGSQCRFKLPKGVYIIQARTEDGIQRQMKVVVK